MSGVDLLATLEHAFISLRIDGRIDESDKIDLARAAVAELIEAADEVLYELRDKSEAKAALIAALKKARGK